MGFVAGVLFWNLVGFVPGAGLVLRDPHVAGVITGSLGKSTEKPPGANCVALALDRREQMTRA